MLRVSSDELKRIWNLAPSGLTGTAKSTRYVRLLPAGYAVSSETPTDARTGEFTPYGTSPAQIFPAATKSATAQSARDVIIFTTRRSSTCRIARLPPTSWD